MDGRAGWTREQRKQQIVNLLLWGAFEQTEQFVAGWLSTREIAKKAELKPTGYLRGILQDLTDEGCLCREDGTAMNGALKHFWQLQEIARWVEPYKSVIDTILENEDLAALTTPEGEN